MFSPADYYITPEEFEIAEKNGISRKLLMSRIRDLGWDKKTAIIKKPRQLNKIKKWLDLAKSNGICEATFLTRIRKLNWDMKRAATEPVNDKTKVTEKLSEISRKYPKEIVDLANKNNIPYETFRARVTRTKMSLYEAATTPVMTKQEVAKIANKAYEEIYGHSFAVGGR